MRTVALVLLGAVAVASAGPRGSAAPVPKHLLKEPEGDQARLQGNWKVESIKVGNNDLMAGAGQNVDLSLDIRGDAFVITVNVDDMYTRITGTIKHGAAGAKRFTTTGMSTVDRTGKPLNPGNEIDQQFGYAFDGGKLVLVLLTGAKRAQPADPLKPGPNDVVVSLVRAKDQ